MSEMAKPALDVVMNDEVKFHPEKFKNTYKHWMDNIRDWNISRQLWWGQQIPAFFYGDGQDDFVVAETIEEALILAKEKSQISNLQISDLKQDEDALDTWFSSWLWPMSVFDGLLDPENKEINYYYPTSDLVTGPDIIFFWVARMIMAGIEYRKEVPFKNVYFTGIVRDKQRRKMSKSLGNSPDPIDLIEKYGADGVRVGILLSSSAGNDLLFDEELMLQGRNFATKIWNSNKLIQGWQKDDSIKANDADQQAIAWFGNQMDKTITEIADQFEKFRISDALHLVYKLIWDDFCSWYLEAIKPNYGEAISTEVYNQTIQYFEELMKLLHPFMPFLSEELWQNISERTVENALVIAQQRKVHDYDKELIKNFEVSKELISGVRNYRQSKGISPRESVEVFTNITSFDNENLVRKLANIEQIYFAEKTDKPTFSFLIGGTEVSIPLSENLDLGEEKTKTEEEIKYLKGFMMSVDKKLSNEKFMAGAPQQVVDNELKKKKDAQDKLVLLEEKLKTLS